MSNPGANLLGGRSQSLAGITEISGAPARFARCTKDLSKETNWPPGGLLPRCIASANSTPCATIASAAATDDSSSAFTFFRPSSLVNASRIALCSNPYRLRSTQPVSSNTVFAIQIGWLANKRRAAAACFGSSPVSSRTRTLVSTAITPPPHFPADGSAHLRGRFRPRLGPEASGHFCEIAHREALRRPQHNPVARLFDRKLHARPPSPGIPNTLRQNDLPLGGKPRGLHG